MFMKKLLLSYIFVLLSLSVSAHDFAVGGVYYNIVSSVNHTVEVTFLGPYFDSSENEYRGTVTIPSTVTYEEVQYRVINIGDEAFYDCTSLTAVVIPEGVTGIGASSFRQCTGLTSIHIPEGVLSLGEWAFGDCSSLATVTIPQSVTAIGEGAFYNCSSLNSIALPKAMTSIGGGAFYNCAVLKTVSIPESVTHIKYSTFSSCTGLTEILLPEGLTTIESGAFQGCSSLVSALIPASVASIDCSAFQGCRSLVSIKVAADNSTYQSPDGCNAIIEAATNSLIIGCSTTVIPENVRSIGENAFYDCGGLVSVTIPEGVTSIGSWAFYNCNNLSSVTIPQSVVSIGSGAFNGCSSITSIAIPENVTNIQSWTFYDCASLVSVSIPSSVTKIGSNAFYGCHSLQDFFCYAKEAPRASTNSFNNSSIGKATLHILESVLETYKTSMPWSKFGAFVGVVDQFPYISATTATLSEGESMMLTAAFTPSDMLGNAVLWSSNNTDVATVDNKGLVTAIAPGTAVITAQASDDSGVSVSCEVTVMPASYQVTFIVDGKVYHTESVTYGAAITVPDAPTKEGHTFSGWGAVPETMPAKDITVRGTFTVNKYRVTFKIGDEVIAIYTQDYGSAITAPDAPEREGHTFSGWGNVAKTVPASDVTYEGSYSVNSYTLTYTVDGEVVRSESVTYGAAITVTDAPTKEGHTFSGWGAVPETMPAKDITVRGTFTVNKYQVTFKIGDEVVATYTQDYGSAITAPDAPEREGHTFSGWGAVPETMPAKDITVHGTFTVNKYRVTFKIGNEVIATYTQDYGSAITAPDVPEREGYTFDGWSEVPETVPAADVICEGSYTANLYKVYYMVGATLVHTAEVAYGEPIPEYAYEAEEGYIFLGWVGESYDTMPAHDVTYTANIGNGIEQLTIDKSQLTIYDLKGRKVADTENLKGGVYIVNGKKVFLK